MTNTWGCALQVLPLLLQRAGEAGKGGLLVLPSKFCKGVHRIRPYLHLGSDSLLTSGIRPNKPPEVAGPYHPSALDPSKGGADRGGGVCTANGDILARLREEAPQGDILLQDGNDLCHGRVSSGVTTVIRIPGLKELWHFLPYMCGKGVMCRA